MTFVKCIAIRQPATSLIVDKHLMNNLIYQKNIENRNNSLFNSTKFKPFNILILSCKKKMSKNKINKLLNNKKKLINYLNTIQHDKFPTGCIIGAAKICDMKKYEELNQKNIWTRGPWCMILTEIIKLPIPIPYKGNLGLFNVPFKILGSTNINFLKKNDKNIKTFEQVRLD